MELKVEGFRKLIKKIDQMEQNIESDLKKVGIKAKTEWMREAKLRVPVDTGVTRNSILGNSEITDDKLTVEVGSNQKHAQYIEFGNKFIAGGAVADLGTDPEITDAQAIHSWHAKDGKATDATSASIDPKTGRLRNKSGQFVAGNRGVGGKQEQMPWLRTSFMAIKDKVVVWLGDCLRPK